MATESLPNSELSILGRIIDPEDPSLSPEAARSILLLDFRGSDHERMSALLTKNREGKLSDNERAELESYNNVSHLIALWQSKARVSLKRANLKS